MTLRFVSVSASLLTLLSTSIQSMEEQAAKVNDQVRAVEVKNLTDRTLMTEATIESIKHEDGLNLPTEAKNTISNTDICVGRYGIVAAVILPLGLFIDPMPGYMVAALIGGLCFYEHWLEKKNCGEEMEVKAKEEPNISFATNPTNLLEDNEIRGGIIPPIMQEGINRFYQFEFNELKKGQRADIVRSDMDGAYAYMSDKDTAHLLINEVFQIRIDEAWTNFYQNNSDRPGRNCSKNWILKNGQQYTLDGTPEDMPERKK